VVEGRHLRQEERDRAVHGREFYAAGCRLESAAVRLLASR